MGSLAKKKLHMTRKKASKVTTTRDKEILLSVDECVGPTNDEWNLTSVNAKLYTLKVIRIAFSI